ncbi:hypothetical protein [uncultured Desulfobacter sp.]|nr:hypothetical protein [uncultured Desulfobacter sp.]
MNPLFQPKEDGAVPGAGIAVQTYGDFLNPELVYDFSVSQIPAVEYWN